MGYVASDVERLWDDELELYGWLIEVSKYQKRYDLEPAIRRCLEHPDGDVRAGAIRALGYYLHIDGFAAEAESYMDDDGSVVMAAVLTWAFYHYGTNERNQNPSFSR